MQIIIFRSFLTVRKFNNIFERIFKTQLNE
jgi:hypothetical protein